MNNFLKDLDMMLRWMGILSVVGLVAIAIVLVMGVGWLWNHVSVVVR